MAIFCRVTPTRLPPETGIWFEPNAGQVKGRATWTVRAPLFLTSTRVVYPLPPERKYDRGVKGLASFRPDGGEVFAAR